MLDLILANLDNQIATLRLISMFITVLVNLLFAGAVARDASDINKRGYPTILVSGTTWAFATLVGGIFVAVTYYVIHHYNFSTWSQS